MQGSKRLREEMQMRNPTKPGDGRMPLVWPIGLQYPRKCNEPCLEGERRMHLPSRRFKSAAAGLLLAGALAITALFGAQQLAFADPPVCDGLACTAPSDCGSKCFCNRPSGHCYVDN